MKKQVVEARLFPRPHGKPFIEVGEKNIQVRVMLDSGLTVFLMSPVFCNQSKVPKVQREIPAAIRGFSGEVVAGEGKAFTKPLKMRSVTAMCR